MAALVKGDSIAEAASRAGYSRSGLAQKLQSPRSALRRAFLEICETQGLTDEAIAGAIFGALNANIVVTSAKELKAVVTKYPEHNTRLRAAQMAAELKGHFPEKGDEKALVQVIIESPIFDKAPQAQTGAFIVESLDKEPTND